MRPDIILGFVLFVLGLLFFITVIFLSTLKHFRRNYFPSWKVLDYLSVGYFEHLYKKYIKRV